MKKIIGYVITTFCLLASEDDFVIIPTPESIRADVKTYVGRSRILRCFIGEARDAITAAIETGMSQALEKTLHDWMRHVLPSIENFYWRFYHSHFKVDDDYFDRIKHLFQSTKPLNESDFQTFFERNAGNLSQNDCNASHDVLLDIYVAMTSPSESNAFFSFCRYYTSGVRNFAERIFTYKDLLGAYIAFSTDSERETFIQFCEGFFLASSVFDRAHLLPVYKRSPEEQGYFRNFCWQMQLGTLSHHNSPSINSLWQIYLAFPEPAERIRYLNFYKQNPSPGTERQVFMYAVRWLIPAFKLLQQPSIPQELDNILQPFGWPSDKKEKIIVLTDYFARPYNLLKNNSDALSSFLTWAGRPLWRVPEKWKPYQLHYLAEIYQRLDDEKKRKECFQFYEWYERLTDSSCQMEHLFPIYLAGQADDSRAFVAPHSWLVAEDSMNSQESQMFRQNILKLVVNSYLPRTYLRFMRAISLRRALFYTPSFRKIYSLYQLSTSESLINSFQHTIPYRFESDLPDVQNIWNQIHQSGENLQKLRQDAAKPEMWREYEAFFDDFYKRTKDPSTGKYVQNAQTREIDAYGNLIERYNDDGTLRTTPLTVYPSGIFFGLESKFVHLLKQHYQNQRGEW